MPIPSSPRARSPIATSSQAGSSCLHARLAPARPCQGPAAAHGRRLRLRYPALGWGLRGTCAPWGERLELFHEHEGFRNLDDSALVLRSKTGLRMPLVARMSATAQFNVDWESRPAPGRDSTDSVLLLGVDYAW